MEEKVKAALHELLGKQIKQLDEEVLEYVEGTLGDPDMEWGDDGGEAYDAVGEMLLESGAFADEDAGRELFKELWQRVSREGTGAATSAAKTEFRKLESALVIGGLTKEEQGGEENTHLTKGLITQCADTLADRDEVKIAKKKSKEEQKAAAAYEKHLQQAQQPSALRRIIRNQGGIGQRDIKLENLVISNGGEELIRDCGLTLSWGHRYGLVGRNGTGKTTFLRQVSDRSVEGLNENIQVLHVEQEVVGDDTPVLQAVLECDAERSQLLEEEKQLLEKQEASTSEADKAQVADRLSEVYTRLVEIDADAQPSRAAAILAGLSFDAEMQQKATKTFSGGWRMRVALARALFVQPDLLMLDEPTNHLDLHAVLWLEHHLQQWPSTLVMVSHARDFLNAVCTDIIQLQNRALVQWKGNFDMFEGAKAEKERQTAKRAEADDRKRKHMQAFLDRFGAVLRQRAEIMRNRMNRMEKIMLGPTDPDYVFRFPEVETVAPPVLGFTDVAFTYNKHDPKARKIFTNLDFGLDMDSRVALIGPNGIGKTTLLNLIAGRLDPTTGHIYRNPKVRIAAFAQHHVDGMDMANTPLGYMVGSFPSVLPQELRSHLGSFGITGQLALQPIYTLSGGQKSRVALAKITWTKPHILLLDEPSNHLDIDAVDALIEGIALFKGGVLLVSHDEHLITNMANELWALKDSTFKVYPGTFQEYKNELRSSVH